MKKTILMLLLATTLAFAARAQALQNTWWRAYNLSNVAGDYFHFGQDTLYESFNNISYFAVEMYTTNNNLYTVIDSIATGCLLVDTGRYTFSIQSDTLRFILISEHCWLRQFFYTTNFFVRNYVGIEDINPISTAIISPNPSTDGIFNLKFSDYNNLPERMYVLSADGRKIGEENFTGNATNHIINLQSCASGIYFLVMENEKGRKMMKLVK